jgi:hypothetical protein
MFETPELIAACEKARLEGKDFPTVWRTVLRPHPLVLGLPTHEVSGGEARILISLRTGQKVVSARDGYLLR